ncbi:nudix hydrolase 24, chloroplastic-like [Centruroides sculpturatus]|uniref:nudix hydrolase 24, chloroplastic-like n=1 Tax=Centruroides sculpturatus TaxID=218467 RepID=UPI000C6D0EDD|nr:nudix hydrolase 24, chloroplastic-like [Centruroides sculpturatus]
MSWSDKLELLLRNFETKPRIDGRCCKPFYIGDQQVGVIRPDIWQHLSKYPQIFHYNQASDSVTLNPNWRTYDERSTKLDLVLQEIRKQNIFKTLAGWRDECYDVSAKFGDPALMKIERSATFQSCGVSGGFTVGMTVLECVRKEAQEEASLPDALLDRMRSCGTVSGGFTVGMTVLECVRKEAQEEASLPDALLDRMRSCGTVSFIYEDERGILPETMFVFDLELPIDFQPRNSDGEVESFHLLTVEETKQVVVTEDFKQTSSLIVLDFLVRHGYLNADDEPNYTQLIEMIHRPLHHLYDQLLPSYKNSVTNDSNL